MTRRVTIVRETQEVAERTRFFKREGGRGLFFETRDMGRGGARLHRSYLSAAR